MIKQIIAATFITMAFVPNANAFVPSPTPVLEFAKKQEKCSAKKFRIYTRKVYAKDKISKKEIEKVYRLRKCLRPWALRFQKNLGKQRQARLEIKKITPYPGPNGTKWAIPWRIVNCESGGSWTADNPTSDARGAYQLLGHGEPWPANTPARKAAHHRIASNLWSGGSGASHWVCK